MMPESILQPLDTPGGRIWRCRRRRFQFAIYRKSVKPLFLPLQVTLTSYPLQKPVGYRWLQRLHMVTYGYIWLQVVADGYKRPS